MKCSTVPGITPHSFTKVMTSLIEQLEISSLLAKDSQDAVLLSVMVTSLDN
jgi:hypothetical protein